MLPMRRAGWIMLAGVFVIAAIAIAADHFYRCSAQPLSREEASNRGVQQLERYKKSFQIHEDMRLEEARFDQDTKAWLLTYAGKRCSVIIIVDRCHGDEVGGTNACAG